VDLKLDSLFFIKLPLIKTLTVSKWFLIQAKTIGSLSLAAGFTSGRLNIYFTMSDFPSRQCFLNVRKFLEFLLL
jgi:hypothetical protein